MIRATHGACTHIGRFRRDNEDAFVVVDGLYMVADGMGGHSAGEVASALTVATLKDAYLIHADPNTKPGLRTPEQVAEAIALANTAVFVEALDDPSKSGMGTTLTGIVVTEPEKNAVVVVNVGDSRTYLWRNGEFHQVTKDHSHVQTLVDRGAITPAEARVHYQRNIVLRAIGIDAEVHVDLFPLTVENGDRFIMCSDGLVDEADDDEIINEIRLQERPQDLAERLVQLANDNGGRDNITVVVVDFEIVATETDIAKNNDVAADPGAENTHSTTTIATAPSTESSTQSSPKPSTQSARRTLPTSAFARLRVAATTKINSAVHHRRAPAVAIVAALVAVITVIVAIISSL